MKEVKLMYYLFFGLPSSFIVEQRSDESTDEFGFELISSRFVLFQVIESHRFEFFFPRLNFESHQECYVFSSRILLREVPEYFSFSSHSFYLS